MFLSRFLLRIWPRIPFLSLPVFAFAVFCVSTVGLADEATSIWENEPVVGDQIRFVDVISLTEEERPFQRFRFQSGADFQDCRIEARVPAMIPVEEFLVRTRVNSTHAGLRLGIRLVLPGQRDPESNGPLTTWLFGERSTNASEWQSLKVGTPSQIDAEIFRVRSRLAPVRIDTQGLYIDRVSLLSQFSTGACVIDIEPVSYGPIVLRSSSDDPVIELPSESSVAKRTGRLRVERNQVFLNGERRLLQMMPDHGESLQTIRELGINTLWTQNQDMSERPRDLSEAGIIVAVTPPHPRFDPADFSRPLNGLMPLHHQMETADIFCLGNRVLPHQLPHLLAWARLVRSSDRLLRRPILADVTASEGLASRQIDMVGIGVPSLHRCLTFGGFRNSILHKTRRASQMTLPWTWIQTESPGSMTRWRQAVGLDPLVVEPEQITMQVIAALSAGVRAIAFWKTQPFGGGQLQESEVGLVVALSSLQIQLLESWLVTGQAQTYIAVDDGRSSSRSRSGTKPKRLQSVVATSPVSLDPVKSAIPRTPDAAVISGRDGSLMIVALWDDSSHYVPGQLYARKASLIATARETSSAAQITMTDVTGLPRNAQPGGLAVTLKDLDLFGVILVSSNPEIFGEMRRRVQSVAPRAAELKCAIARLKYQRVSETCANIDQLAPQAPPSASQWLVNAARMLKYAETALQNDRFQEADRRAEGCLRALRATQNLYWTTAIRQLPTPTASPYTVAFSSLPEHWQMMATIGSAQPSDNLLPPGPFHRRHEMEQMGWTFPELTDNVYKTRSRLRDDSNHNIGFLQLAAWKPENTQAPLSTQPSTLVSLPPVVVEAGDLVELRGRVRLSTSAIPAVEEFPLMVFDSELGPEFAVRPALDADWRIFHMYRQAAVSGPLQFTLGLQGSAEVHVDLDNLVVRTVGRARGGDVKSRTALVPE